MTKYAIVRRRKSCLLICGIKSSSLRTNAVHLRATGDSLGCSFSGVLSSILTFSDFTFYLNILLWKNRKPVYFFFFLFSCYDLNSKQSTAISQNYFSHLKITNQGTVVWLIWRTQKRLRYNYKTTQWIKIRVRHFNKKCVWLFVTKLSCYRISYKICAVCVCVCRIKFIKWTQIVYQTQENLCGRKLLWTFKHCETKDKPSVRCKAAGNLALLVLVFTEILVIAINC